MRAVNAIASRGRGNLARANYFFGAGNVFGRWKYGIQPRKLQHFAQARADADQTNRATTLARDRIEDSQFSQPRTVNRADFRYVHNEAAQFCVGQNFSYVLTQIAQGWPKRQATCEFQDSEPVFRFGYKTDRHPSSAIPPQVAAKVIIYFQTCTFLPIAGRNLLPLSFR